jgi:MYXO-CTERM domain-containing protein
VDEVKTAGTVCNAANPLALCDADDTCDGSAKVCPTVVKAVGETCRASAGTCDVAETCDGSLDACPDDVFAAIDTPCGDEADPAQACDADDACDGAGSCTDRVLAAGTSCGNAADPQLGCDADDACDGAAKSCPDVVIAAGVTCRAAAGDCDEAETCDGSSNACAADALKPLTFECRPSLGSCDPAETCAGAADCPTDVLTPDGTTCGDGLMCSTAGMCDQGTCANTVAEDCDDADPCTVDACAEPNGCTHTPSSSPECVPDAGTEDAGVEDAGADAGEDAGDDAGTDAGDGSVSGGGCGCEAAGDTSTYPLWLSLAFLGMVARRRVRRL